MDIKDKMELERLITASSRIVFFGGAGVSTESGIPDFRSAQGLYRDNNIRQDYPHTAEVMLSHAFFIENPDLFFQFYRSVILHPQARPFKISENRFRLRIGNKTTKSPGNCLAASVATASSEA